MALKLVQSDEQGELVPLIAGLLLLGSEEAIQRTIPTHKTMHQVLIEARRITANERLASPLLRQVEELEARFDARITEQELMINFQRIPIPAYDRTAFREAILNTLVHRDYSMLGAVYIQWHPDHLFITSPGSFPRGVTRENLLTHEPVPRNPRLAEVCARIGLVETTARGVDRIYEGQLRLGHGLPDYGESDEGAVRLRLQSAGANLDLVRFVRLYELKERRLKLEELVAFFQIYQTKRLDLASFRSAIQRSEQAAKGILEGLVSRGLLEVRGTKHRTFILSAEAQRTFGQASEYVRIRGLDPIRQNAMIEAYLEAHGQVTRMEVAELCLVDPEEASRILLRLVAERRVVRQGAKRGAYYVLNRSEPLSPLAGLPLKALISELLVETSPMSLQEIDEALAARGFEVAGNNKRNYLTSIMSRSKTEFKGLGQGRYEARKASE